MSPVVVLAKDRGLRVTEAMNTFRESRRLTMESEKTSAFRDRLKFT